MTIKYDAEEHDLHAGCIKQEYRYTLLIVNIYCFFMTTTVTQCYYPYIACHVICY